MDICSKTVSSKTLFFVIGSFCTPHILKTIFQFLEKVFVFQKVCSEIHLKHIAQPKLKVYFLKNLSTTINEEVKKGKFNCANQIYYHQFHNQININAD